MLHAFPSRKKETKVSTKERNEKKPPTEELLYFVAPFNFAQFIVEHTNATAQRGKRSAQVDLLCVCV